MGFYTPEEVGKHCTKDDLWITIDGTVYDVTSFHVNHPGGKNLILDFAGMDATEPFEDIGHSSTARSTLQELSVGRLKPNIWDQEGIDQPIPKKKQSSLVHVAWVISAAALACGAILLFRNTGEK